MSVSRVETATCCTSFPSTIDPDLGTTLVSEFVSLVSVTKATDCLEDASFWEDLLQRAEGLATAAPIAWEKWQALINELSPEIIASLSEPLRGRWNAFHRRYLSLGGTSEGMLQDMLLGVTEGWTKCSERYQPLIRSQLARYCKVPYDLEEVTQDVMVRLDHVLRREEFERQRHGSFRKLLGAVIFHVIKEYERKNNNAAVTFVPVLTEWASDVDDINSIVMREWHEALLRSLLEALEAHFQRQQATLSQSTAMRDFEIFQAYTLPKWRGERVPAVQVADRFQVSLSVVYENDGKVRALCRRLLERQGWGDDL